MAGTYAKYSALAGGGSGGGGITSINGDTTAAQVIAAGSGIAVSSSGGTTTISSSGGSGANTALSNLASTAVNADINPASAATINLGGTNGFKTVVAGPSVNGGARNIYLDSQSPYGPALTVDANNYITLNSLNYWDFFSSGAIVAQFFATGIAFMNSALTINSGGSIQSAGYCILGGNLALQGAATGIKIASGGTNRMFSVTLASGTATFTAGWVSTTTIPFMTVTSPSSQGFLSYSISGTTITFHSSNASDASTLWVVVIEAI
jgi:hypothetical protein